MQESLNRGIWAASGKVGLQTDQERDVVWTEKQQRWFFLVYQLKAPKCGRGPMSDYGDFHISSPFYWLTFDSISATQGVSSNFLGYPVGQDTDSRYRAFALWD
ncbi:hypothetical protein FG05_35254 [Fusarium graminearum]|nr:hypothetical protein FG05_35254 [Fusarium graminearum]